MPEESLTGIAFLQAAQAEQYREGLFVVIVRTRNEFSRWLQNPAPGLEWLQVEGLLADPDVWALAAQGAVKTQLDVILSDPATEFSSLYRLVDVRIVRPVRVTIPARPGLMKALRLAASLQIPVRLLPGQPGVGILAELTEALNFYLCDPMVDAPVEFFHSVLAAFRHMGEGTLWDFLEQDPAVFFHRDEAGHALQPADFVEAHLTGLINRGAECSECRWQPVCAGYFKWPDPSYDCAGVKALFETLASAADEITDVLASQENPVTTSALQRA